MRAIHRKLLRDLTRARGQVASTALVVAAGIAAYLSLMGTYQALRRSQQTYYERSGFPQLFAAVRRAPESIAPRLRAIPDVAQVQTRIVIDARFDLLGLPEPAAGRVVALPPDDEPGLPAIHLTAGRLPDPLRPREAVVLSTFAAAHHLVPGDALPVIVDGRRLVAEIVGVAMSPEYVFAIGAGGLYQPRRFCVLWMRRAALERQLGMVGQLNDVTLRLRPGADAEEAITAVDRVLAPWGSLGAHGRREQPSHRALDGELQQLEGLALRVPLIFLAVQAFLLHIVLGRLVAAQREQIAALKAIGYGRRAVAGHYLTFAAVVVALGCGLGLLLGSWGSAAFTRLYMTFFHLPTLAPAAAPVAMATAVASSLAAAFLGAWRSVSRAMRLPPAEAMRPPVPARYRRGPLSAIGVPRLLAHTGRMVVRELERRPGRAVLSSLGIAMGIAILVVGRFQYDALDWLIETDLGRAMPADATVMFSTPVDAAAARALAGMPGILAVEPVYDLPVRIRARHRARTIALHGTVAAPILRHITQLDGTFATIPAAGVALGGAVSRAIGAGIGDRITLERLDGDHRQVEVAVAAVIEDLAGMMAYARRDVVGRLFDQEPLATSALIQLDPRQLDDVQRRLRAAPRVATLTIRRETIDVFRATTGAYSGVFTLLIVLFGTVLAVGIIHGNARVAVSERGRDLATLRVLGFRRDEVSAVLLGELAVQLLVAIPVGMAIGKLLALAALGTTDPEMYRLPLVIYPRTYAFAVMTVIGAGLVSALLVRRKLDGLDLIGALKARD